MAIANLKAGDLVISRFNQHFEYFIILRTVHGTGKLAGELAGEYLDNDTDRETAIRKAKQAANGGTVWLYDHESKTYDSV